MTRIRENATWIFSRLAVSVGVDFEQLAARYFSEFSSLKKRMDELVHFIHLSDTHIGCKEANLRLPRLQQLIRSLISDLGENSETFIIHSGDILDSPEQKFHDEARRFIDILAGFVTQPPIMMLGNHDVREDGFLSEDLRQAIQIPTSRVFWHDPAEFGIMCFNSVMGGRLAQGKIGERQFADVGSELDRHPNGKRYTLLAALHHHPIPVERPEWHARKWYERWLGDSFEATVALEDRDDFISFVKKRRVAAVLHGHKHIPRIDNLPESKIPVFGCGSSVGKVRTKDGKPYMSINVVSYSPSSKRLTCRLLAERVPGGGLTESKTHEFTYLG
jgi:3',5'-cyclic AMP phosphodiesterase CpdA